MFVHKLKIVFLLSIFTCFSNAQAQEANPGTPQLKVDVCSGSARLLKFTETDKGINLDIEVTIADCKGTCTGTLEYDMVFADANGVETKWRMTGEWDWRTVDKPFTLQVSKSTLVNSTLKTVSDMRLGRCSCSTLTAR
jgi:hypothetical protein